MDRAGFFVAAALFRLALLPETVVIVLLRRRQPHPADYPSSPESPQPRGVRCPFLNYGRSGIQSEIISPFSRKPGRIIVDKPIYILLQLGTNDVRTITISHPSAKFRATCPLIIGVFGRFAAVGRIPRIFWRDSGIPPGEHENFGPESASGQEGDIYPAIRNSPRPAVSPVADHMRFVCRPGRISSRPSITSGKDTDCWPRRLGGSASPVLVGSASQSPFGSEREAGPISVCLNGFYVSPRGLRTDSSVIESPPVKINTRLGMTSDIQSLLDLFRQQLRSYPCRRLEPVPVDRNANSGAGEIDRGPRFSAEGRTMTARCEYAYMLIREGILRQSPRYEGSRSRRAVQPLEFSAMGGCNNVFKRISQLSCLGGITDIS
jgi:hypothetical protein